MKGSGLVVEFHHNTFPRRIPMRPAISCVGTNTSDTTMVAHRPESTKTEDVHCLDNGAVHVELGEGGHRGREGVVGCHGEQCYSSNERPLSFGKKYLCIFSFYF